MDIANHVVVLNFGEVIGEGTPTEVRADPEVVRAYLGGAAPVPVVAS
jgi:branched-chain amino acid transport system ATP-binding protein